jgi:transcriptional regulator with XRE-family HTH domain
LRVARDPESRRERSFKRPKDELHEENKVIGQRLRAARDARHLSQRAVAAILGENQSWVSKVEQGERRADLAEGARMMRLYAVEPNAILMPEGLAKARARSGFADGAGLAADRSGSRRRGKVVRPRYRGPGARSVRGAKSKKAAQSKKKKSKS